MYRMFLAGAFFLAALPATSTYKLNSYGFGSGGTANSSTSTYSLEGQSGGFNGQTTSTTTGSVKPGFTETQQANVPKLSALDNNGGQYYNKLHFVIDAQGNPSDAKYLLAVSTDNFASNTSYLQPDGTLGASAVLSDYQTYSAWGGASGSYIIGLTPATTYYVKLKATQGKFTESAYGPVSSQATASPSLTFSLGVFDPGNSTTTPAPTSLSLGTLSAGSVATTAKAIKTTFDTNGAAGGDIYIKGQNGKLQSSVYGTNSAGRIDSISTDLSSAGKGYGGQISSSTLLTPQSPYSGGGNTVGVIDSTLRSLFSTSSAVSGGVGQFVLKAKADTSTVAASDYQEILTFVAAANF